jgi:hypothetical protein
VMPGLFGAVEWAFHNTGDIKLKLHPHIHW